MTRLGLVARADDGGLGNLTAEFARHLLPDRVLVMDLGEYGRSDVRLDRYADFDTRIVHGLGPSRDDRKWLLDGCDVLYTAETFYDPTLATEAAEAGVRTILHAMPELFCGSLGAEVWLPTTYRETLIPGARVVPVPVALDRHVTAVRSPARHFVALWSPAMMDRNGVNVVLAALEMVRTPCRVTVIGAQRRVELPEGHPVTLVCEPTGEYPTDYWDIWPDDADVLLLPRRYAGLSMPVQEAAARGMPAVMTACEPQDRWPGVVRVPARGRPERVRMAGGLVDVWDPDPVSVAHAIERLATDDAFAAEMSGLARSWAEALSWDVWAPRYGQLLGLG